MLVTGCDQGILELFEVHPLHRLSGVPRDTKGATGKTLDFPAHSEFSIGTTCKKARIAPLRIKMSNLEFSQESTILDIYRCGYSAPRCAPGCAARGVLIARKSAKSDAGGRHQRHASKEASEELGQN